MAEPAATPARVSVTATRTATRPASSRGFARRVAVYVEHYAVGDPTTGRCQATLQVERYDLKQDPYELQNQCTAGLPSNCPTGPEQLKLEQDLQRLRNCAGIKGRDQQVDGRPFCG